MIHIFVGTKAQFIKMMPIMQALTQKGIHYNFIDAGQHGRITGVLIEQFNLRKPDVYLRKNAGNIATVSAALRWTLKSLGHLTFSSAKVFKDVFGAQGGICLIHGDTLTTLISLLYAKKCGLKVAHVEAGLRSFNLLDPFPEEIIRLLAMRFSDLLFAPSDSAMANLHQMGYKKKTINIRANTGQDAVSFALQRTLSDEFEQNTEAFVVVTIHRLETLFSTKRLEFITDYIIKISQFFKVVFVLHDPTIKQLEKYGFLKKIQRAQIELRPLQAYIPFIHLLSKAQFVVTDGGSVQEECYFLNKPCLIMRTNTEREEGIGKNALLSEFDKNRCFRFISNYIDFKRNLDFSYPAPSESIVKHIISFA